MTKIELVFIRQTRENVVSVPKRIAGNKAKVLEWLDLNDAWPSFEEDDGALNLIEVRRIRK